MQDRFINTETETKWPTFRRQHFQMDFLEWICSNFDRNNSLKYVRESPDDENSTGLFTGLEINILFSFSLGAITFLYNSNMLLERNQFQIRIWPHVSLVPVMAWRRSGDKPWPEAIATFCGVLLITNLLAYPIVGCRIGDSPLVEPAKHTLIARFMGPTCGPSGADRTQVGPMLAPWTLLSEYARRRVTRYHALVDTGLNTLRPRQYGRHFCRHFHMHFLEWRFSKFKWNFIEICSS